MFRVIHGSIGRRCTRPIEWISPRPCGARQRSMTRPERRVVLVADVLEHADGDERVVLTLDLAVVVEAELDPVRETFGAGALARRTRPAPATCCTP